MGHKKKKKKSNKKKYNRQTCQQQAQPRQESTASGSRQNTAASLGTNTQEAKQKVSTQNRSKEPRTPGDGRPAIDISNVIDPARLSATITFPMYMCRQFSSNIRKACMQDPNFFEEIAQLTFDEEDDDMVEEAVRQLPYIVTVRNQSEHYVLYVDLKYRLSLIVIYFIYEKLYGRLRRPIIRAKSQASIYEAVSTVIIITRTAYVNMATEGLKTAFAINMATSYQRLCVPYIHFTEALKANNYYITQMKLLDEMESQSTTHVVVNLTLETVELSWYRSRIHHMLPAAGLKLVSHEYVSTWDHYSFFEVWKNKYGTQTSGKMGPKTPPDEPLEYSWEEARVPPLGPHMPPNPTPPEPTESWDKKQRTPGRKTPRRKTPSKHMKSGDTDRQTRYAIRQTLFDSRQSKSDSHKSDGSADESKIAENKPYSQAEAHALDDLPVRPLIDVGAPSNQSRPDQSIEAGAQKTKTPPKPCQTQARTHAISDMLGKLQVDDGTPSNQSRSDQRTEAGVRKTKTPPKPCQTQAGTLKESTLPVRPQIDVGAPSNQSRPDQRIEAGARKTKTPPKPSQAQAGTLKESTLPVRPHMHTGAIRKQTKATQCETPPESRRRRLWTHEECPLHEEAANIIAALPPSATYVSKYVQHWNTWCAHLGRR